MSQNFDMKYSLIATHSVSRQLYMKIFSQGEDPLKWGIFPTAIFDQTKRIFESVAKQRFQKSS